MNKAFFLDRDGVINIDGDYVSTIEGFQFIDGVFEACKIILSKGYKIIIITNQSGIGRGYYTEGQFFELNRWMIDKFKGDGIHLTDVYFCPHHPINAIEPYNIDCECRKPKPGMIQKAKMEHDIDLSQSVLVGDRLSDITSGKSAEVGALYLVSNNKEAEPDTYKCHNLLDAVQQFFSI